MLSRVVFGLLCVGVSACGGGEGGGSSAIEEDVPVGSARPDLGVNADLNGYRLFPADNAWNARVDGLPVDPLSDAIVDRIGRDTPLHPDFGADWDGGPFGIPYVVVGDETADVTVEFGYEDESDPGPYPIPTDAPIEGGPTSDGDRHVLVFDRDDGLLYELFDAWPTRSGWTAGSGAVFHLDSNALRPAGWTSADAAGLPILPGLVRRDAVVGRGEIRHALRFTCQPTRRAYLAPATHWASTLTDADLPPMGMRVRLKASVDLSGFPPQARVVAECLKRYGMLLADNGGDWYVSGVPDPSWDDEDLNVLKMLTGDDFEVVLMGPVTTG